MGFILILFGFLAVAGAVNAADARNPAQPAETADRIHITADKLISDTRANTAEFIGNVHATQKNTVITSDRLKIFYARDDGEKQEQSLKKIIATGNVTIKMDDKVAVTEQAVYTASSETLILTGPNSKITSENNFVSGDKITLYRNEDRMIVDGSAKERVEAVLYTKDKGIQ